MIRRRCGESVFLGEDIEVQVLEVTGSRVKLGIAAPREVLVLRKELKLTEEFNREASRPTSPDNLARLAAAILRNPAHPRQDFQVRNSRSPIEI